MAAQIHLSFEGNAFQAYDGFLNFDTFSTTIHMTVMLLRSYP
jgi:hypothetical protein